MVELTGSLKLCQQSFMLSSLMHFFEPACDFIMYTYTCVYILLQMTVMGKARAAGTTLYKLKLLEKDALFSLPTLLE